MKMETAVEEEDRRRRERIYLRYVQFRNDLTRKRKRKNNLVDNEEAHQVDPLEVMKG